MTVIKRLDTTDPKPAPPAAQRPSLFAGTTAEWRSYDAALSAWLARHPDDPAAVAARQRDERNAAARREQAAREGFRRAAANDDEAARDADPATTRLLPLWNDGHQVGARSRDGRASDPFDGDHVVAVLGGEPLGERSSRWLAVCPCCRGGLVYEQRRWVAEWCSEDEGDVTQHACEGVDLRCLSGCSGEQLSAIVVPLASACAREWEDDERRDAESAQAAERAAELAQYSLARLATVDAPHWLISDWLPDRTLTLLGGDGGSRKTWLVIEWALCLAAGIPFLGCPVKRTRVYLVLLESTDEDHAERLQLCAAGLGVDLAALIRDGWIYMSPAGTELRLDVPASAAQLDRAVALFDPGVIVVDNLNKAHSGDENSAAATTAAMRKLEHLARTRAVILLAHVEKKGGELRGSTAIRNNAGHVLKLVAASESNHGIVTLSTGKARLGGAPPIKFRLVGDRKQHEPIIFERADETPKPKPPGDRKRESMIELLAEPTTKDDVYDALGGRRADAVKLFAGLVADQLVAEVAPGLWQRTEGTP